MTAKFWAASFLIAAAVAPSFAQEVSAGITGRVTDPSGSAIVNAKVLAKDLDRDTEWPTTTNIDGIYAFPRIPPGRYSLKIEATGFKTYINPEVGLEVNQRARVDVAMQVGAITESVEVTGEAPLLQTDTTQVGAVIASTTINDTPLISRNPVALTLLTAGVTTPDPNSFNSGLRSAGGGRPYVNGNREESNNFLLDGVDNNFTSDNLVSYQPNPDAIEEFKLITNNASAEFGNFQGGIINVVIKSGTNQLHGDVFEYFRNDKLNADNWGRNWQGLPRPPLRWNQFGGTAGGRVIKDRLFFFADYQGLRQATPTSLSSAYVMPTPWRSGDFSSLLNTTGPYTVGKVIQLYNPFSVDPATSLRAPFPGNIIPQSLLSPAAVKLMTNSTLYPAPQTTTISTPNYTYGSASYIKTDQGDAKLDWKPRDNDYASFRYSHGMQDNPGVNTFPLFYNSFNRSPFQNEVINWTHTFGPRVVNEARFGVNNVMLDNGGADKGLGNIGLNAGIAAAGAGLLSLQGFTYMSAIGNANIGVQQLFANTTWHYADNVTLIRGRHMMKMGGQALREWINVFYAGNNGRSGYIAFNGKFTGQNALNPSVTLGEADFMLGLPDDVGRGLQSGTWGQRSTVWALYFQDDWRATNSLTLNLGLRWEYHTPWVEVENRQANFNEFTGQLELAAPLPSNLVAPPGQAPLVEGNGALYNTYKKDFQPRIGFAYTPDILGKKLVFRGSYTISSYLEGTGTNLRLPLNPPYEQEFESNYNIAGAQYELPGSTLDQGLSQISAKNPYAGATIRLWDPFVRPADVQQWNFTSEYEFKGGNVLTVGYVGQHGDHLMVAMPYFQNQVVNGTVVPGPYLSGNPTLRGEIGQISGTCSCAKQKYNALQATMHKRFSMGLTYQLAFTYSRGMSDSIGYYGQGAQAGSQSAYWQNLFNQQSEFSPTYFDEKFNFVPSFVYELPFGRGRKMGSSWNRGVDAVLGGWQLGGIYTWHTGFPLTIKLASDPSGTGARSYRADVIGTPHDPHQVGPGNTWLDVSAYATPALHTFGDSAPGVVRGPGESRLDLSIAKQFHLSEKKYFELRGEAFGMTNTPIFYSPASQTITSSLFGQLRSSEGERNMQLVGKFYF
ncbi:MAG TPA: TonB-dependent receptor [Bryobacteraceae bacterium]|nr:TonB-dependent receptor [Bryobacteraceae bacterium]